MEIGSPLPADLETISAAATLNAHTDTERDALIARLHAVHAAYNGESDAIREKEVAVKNVLSRLYVNKGLYRRASFDQVLAQGSGAKYTLAKAQQYLEDAKAGLINLGSGMADRLKRIIDSGKDEQ